MQRWWDANTMCNCEGLIWGIEHNFYKKMWLSKLLWNSFEAYYKDNLWIDECMVHQDWACASYSIICFVSIIIVARGNKFGQEDKWIFVLHLNILLQF